MSDAPQIQAFGALQRLLLVVDPGFGEGRWQVAHSFMRLPPGQQTPGHWYHGQGRGFIQVDEKLNGEFVQELPANVDPASVIEMPPAQHTTVLETMATLLPKIDGTRRAHFQSILDELQKISRKDRDQTYILNYQQNLYGFSLAGTDSLLQYLAKSADFHYGDGLRQGKASGIEAGAALMIRGLAQAIAPDQAGAARVWEMLLAQLALSMEVLSAWMVRDCIKNGLSAQAYAVLDALLREGNGLVEGAREGLFPVGRQDMMLDLYYIGLFSAAPYLRAAMVGYEIAGLNPDLGDQERRLYTTRANAAEEKLARVCDATMFAVRDLDGSQARAMRASIQQLLAAGEQDKAEGLAMEAVDLKLFFPKPFKQALLRPASQTAGE